MQTNQGDKRQGQDKYNTNTDRVQNRAIYKQYKKISETNKIALKEVTQRLNWNLVMHGADVLRVISNSF